MVHDKNGAKFTIHDGSPLAPALVWTGIAVMCAAGCGAMYSTGRGVPQDNIEAHMWLNLAASRSSGADRERSVGVRDRVAERMTPADLSEAQRRAREWHAAHPVP